MTELRDVAVVGGGLVGATAALGLARQGYQVTLIDHMRPRVRTGRLGVDIRNIACSPGSRAVLEAVGVWPALAPAPYRRMSVWEERGTGSLDFTAEEVGREELGWILENSPTVAALWEALLAEPQIEIVLGDLASLNASAEGVVVALAAVAADGGENDTGGVLQAGSGREVRARLLIGADGGRSAVRTLTGVKTSTFATGHHVLATVVQTQKGHDGVAYQRFLLDGPLALLPSREPALSSVVWSQSPELAAERRKVPDDAFCAQVEAAMESRLGRVEAVDDRLAFPLRQHVTESFHPMDRVLLIGDAARVLHPLAGLGANVGFEDVRDLLAVCARLPAGADPGTPGIWRPFARRRRMRSRLMVAAMTGFRRGYALAGPLPNWVRNQTIRWLNGAGPVKEQIIREALGLGPLAAG